MLKVLFFFLLVSITASSWAFYPPSENSQELFESLKGKETEVSNFLKSQIESTNSYGSRNYEIRMTTVAKIEGQPLAEWVPVLDTDSRKLVVELRITEEGLKSPLVMAEEILKLNQITGGSFTHPYQWAETVANARAGSIRATEKLARMDYQAARDVKGWLGPNMSFFQEGTDPAKIEEWTKVRLKEAQIRYEPIMKAAKAEAKKLQTEWEEMRPKFTELEKQEKKFNDLVMANDRAGARRMLETYLPWPLMEPSEKKTWKEWLDAMEHPDLSRRQLVFRGMDGYPVLKSAGSEKVGMFSAVLAMNQGNYTRRLRSLTTSRVSQGISNFYDVETEAVLKLPKDQPSLLVQMYNHAGNPQASPFISVSDHGIASRFGGYERMALLVDERRLVPNAMSFGYGEKERLIPLVVFPEEVVYYRPKAKDGAAIQEEEFLGKVSEALGRPITPEEINMTLPEEEFLKKGFDRLSTTLLKREGESVIGVGCVVGLPCDCISKGLNKLLTP
jgi:hypothetical protein